MSNQEFKALHRHNVQAKKLKKKKSIMKLCGKLARLLVGMARSDEAYNPTVLIMLPFVSWKKLRLTQLTKYDWLLVLSAGFFLGLHFLFWMVSLSYTSVASSMVILTLQPLFVMIGSYFIFKERVNKLMVLCMITAVFGSIIIAWGDIGVSREALIGDALSLLGTVSISAYMLAGQKVSHKIPANVYSVIVFFIGGSIMLIYSLMNHFSLIDYSSSDWMYFLLLALIPTIFGHFIFNRMNFINRMPCWD
ncbi:DMT family transporter [Paenibacillus sp. N3.4]|uniref:DMT family transporter n=1 Tax=Paenibacillus sp. N3.4 TaxID=2603222 RepID=UPI0028FCABA0|nr:DMT family transporter [Paenibacillus sp. N3.4]